MKYDPYYYDGFAVYRKYLAYKLHFTTDKYDYTENSGMIHTKLETFTKRNDRYMFRKLSVKYNQDEIDDFMIANFVKKNKAWSGSLLERDSPVELCSSCVVVSSSICKCPSSNIYCASSLSSWCKGCSVNI